LEIDRIATSPEHLTAQEALEETPKTLDLLKNENSENYKGCWVQYQRDNTEETRQKCFRIAEKQDTLWKETRQNSEKLARI
jgi:hypothetical protein